jgi:hypothetical protein
VVQTAFLRRARVARPSEFNRAISEVLAHFRRRYRQATGEEYELDVLRDTESLIDITHNQAAGSVARARRIVDEMFDAAGGALYGDTLARRFASLLAWYGHGRPRSPRPMTSRELRECREVIADNAMAAAAKESRRAARGSRGAA